MCLTAVSNIQPKTSSKCPNCRFTVCQQGALLCLTDVQKRLAVHSVQQKHFFLRNYFNNCKRPYPERRMCVEIIQPLSTFTPFQTMLVFGFLFCTILGIQEKKMMNRISKIKRRITINHKECQVDRKFSRSQESANDLHSAWK